MRPRIAPQFVSGNVLRAKSLHAGSIRRSGARGCAGATATPQEGAPRQHSPAPLGRAAPGTRSIWRSGVRVTLRRVAVVERERHHSCESDTTAATATPQRPQRHHRAAAAAHASASGVYRPRHAFRSAFRRARQHSPAPLGRAAPGTRVSLPPRGFRACAYCKTSSNARSPMSNPPRFTTVCAGPPGGAASPASGSGCGPDPGDRRGTQRATPRAADAADNLHVRGCHRNAPAGHERRRRGRIDIHLDGLA